MKTAPTFIDISAATDRQTVIAAGTEDCYQGHPTTVLTRTGKLLCVWTTGHGGPCGPAAESLDGGHTWSRIDDRFPSAYAATHQNCPTLQKMTLPDGRERLLVFSAKKITTEYTDHPKCRFVNARTACPLGIVYSDDDGLSWREAPPADLSAMMPPTGFLQLANGSLPIDSTTKHTESFSEQTAWTHGGAVALFGQAHRDPSVTTDRATDDQEIWMATSRDGLSWSPPRIIASAPEKNLCEPCALRSPDGSEIALLLRENRHTGCSMMCFSHDEGATWSTPVDTAPELTGDRHEAIILPDGRLFIAFRDRMVKPLAGGANVPSEPSANPTYGQYVAWVGTWDDLRHARPGAFRIHLLKSWAGNERVPNSSFVGDTGYSGVELLPGDTGCPQNPNTQTPHPLFTVLCTTYTKHWPDARKHSVVCTRLDLPFSTQRC